MKTAGAKTKSHKITKEVALPLSERMIELVARRFRVLGEPTRLRILQALEAGELTVGEITAATSASQSNISRHLKDLCEAGLVDRRRAGNNMCYRIADPIVFKLCALVCHSATQGAHAHLAALTR